MDSQQQSTKEINKKEQFKLLSYENCEHDKNENSAPRVHVPCLASTAQQNLPPKKRMCFRRDPFVPPSLDKSVPPKKRMSYRFPPYVPASKDLTEKYSPSDTEIKCALREICSGPLWEEKNDMETVREGLLNVYPDLDFERKEFLIKNEISRLLGNLM